MAWFMWRASWRTRGETCACTPTRAPPTMPTPIHASFYSSNLCSKHKRTLHLLAMSIRIRAAACSPQYCNSGFQTFGARATTGAERYSLARVVAWLKKIKQQLLSNRSTNVRFTIEIRIHNNKCFTKFFFPGQLCLPCRPLQHCSVELSNVPQFWNS